jgi:hypothetical protein
MHEMAGNCRVIMTYYEYDVIFRPEVTHCVHNDQ